jgi:hypothetical protein
MKLIITESQLKNIILQEDMIRLRTLTLKSVWDVSEKYRGQTVGNILDLHPSTLYWAYTHVQWVNFTDDILQVLAQKFNTFQIIEKPGTDKEQFEKWKNRHTLNDKSYEELRKIEFAKRMNGQNNPELRNLLKSKKADSNLVKRNASPSRAYMQRKNHGK